MNLDGGGIPGHHLRSPHKDRKPRKSVPRHSGASFVAAKSGPGQLPLFQNYGQGRRGQVVESSYYPPLPNSFYNEGG